MKPADIWKEIFPNSTATERTSILSSSEVYFNFYLSAGEHEVPYGIMSNDPLHYSAVLRMNGNFEETNLCLAVRPEEGTYMAFGSAKTRKTTIKDANPDKLRKRFLKVREFVMSNADNVPAEFDITTK